MTNTSVVAPTSGLYDLTIGDSEEKHEKVLKTPCGNFGPLDPVSWIHSNLDQNEGCVGHISGLYGSWSFTVRPLIRVIIKIRDNSTAVLTAISLQKPTKAQKRREQRAAEEAEREARIEAEKATLGPNSEKDVEAEELEKLLRPLGLTVKEIPVRYHAR